MTNSTPIDLQQLQVRRSAFGQLVVTLPDGRAYEGVEPVRCFPLSHPQEAIALLDAEGHEICLLPSLDSLSPGPRELVTEEMRRRSFAPEIKSIIRCSASNPPCRWEVVTDRGPTTFQIDAEDDIRRLPNGGVVIADAFGVRYSVPDPRQLDHQSQQVLRRFL